MYPDKEKNPFIPINKNDKDIKYAVTDEANIEKDGKELPVAKKHTLWNDAVDILALSGKAFVFQFTDYRSLLLICGAGGVTYLLYQDELHQQGVVQEKHILGKAQLPISNVGIYVFNLPVFAFGTYTVGRIIENEKLIQFSMDVLSTMLLADIETGLLRHIPIHRRPHLVREGRDAKGPDTLYGKLQGPSCFPSGHMIGLSAVMFKSWEYYGWVIGVPATLATVLLAWSRVEDGSHYITDVVGAVMLTGIVSFSTSSQNKYLKNLKSYLRTEDGGYITIVPVVAPDIYAVSVSRTF